MNIFISGGGSAEQSVALDKLYFDSIVNESRIAYVPVALRGKRSFKECKFWFQELTASYGEYNVTVLEELSSHHSQLDDVDAVYIGGGNTYNLLQEIKQSRFQKSLLEFAHLGKPIYGGSAGAVILGKDIQTIESMDIDNHNTKDTTGLNIVSGYSVWPHYDSSQDHNIAEYVAETSCPVLAIAEDAGICVQSKLEAIGTVWVFDANGKQMCA